MTNLLMNSILLVFITGVSLAQTDDDYTTDFPTTPLFPAADCTLDGIDILSISEGDAYIANATIYDNIEETQKVSFRTGSDIDEVRVDSPSRYVTKSSGYAHFFIVSPVDEEIEISQPSQTFYYNFTLSVQCQGVYYYQVPALIPIHETNTYTPVFSKDLYEYALFSPYVEDLQRLLELNPIVVNDNDMSNTEVMFSIEQNNYFDLEYEGIILGSLNKNHTARLVPKGSSINIPQTLELVISVTVFCNISITAADIADLIDDHNMAQLFPNLNQPVSLTASEMPMDVGYPRRSSNATIIVRPLNIKVPTFKEPYYVGDYYINNTFVMRSQPQLDLVGIGNNFNIVARLTDNGQYNDAFYANVTENGEVFIDKNYDLPEIAVLKYNYLLYTLTVTFTDVSLNGYMVDGNATIVVELHS